MVEYLNRRNLNALVPSWACPPEALYESLNEQFPRFCGGERSDPFASLDYWIEVKNNTIRFACPNADGIDLSGLLILDDVINPIGALAQVVIPLNPLLAGYEDVEGKHSLYLHSITTDVPLSYFGVTKQKWFARMSQHFASAVTGSPYVFHKALREHKKLKMGHRLVVCGLDYEYVMGLEEKMVAFTLYPKGLNMIPGGHAGLKYLQTLGIAASSFKQRDQAVERLAKMPSVKGQPNPLCAARWQSDQDFINRVICGHGGRLTVEQIRQVRMLLAFGMDSKTVAIHLDAKNERQIDNVMTGKYYSRVK